jgi:hypothetical protein
LPITASEWPTEKTYDGIRERRHAINLWVARYARENRYLWGMSKAEGKKIVRTAIEDEFGDIDEITFALAYDQFLTIATPGPGHVPKLPIAHDGVEFRPIKFG